MAGIATPRKVKETGPFHGTTAYLRLTLSEFTPMQASEVYRHYTLRTPLYDNLPSARYTARESLPFQLIHHCGICAHHA